MLSTASVHFSWKLENEDFASPKTKTNSSPDSNIGHEKEKHITQIGYWNITHSHKCRRTSMSRKRKRLPLSDSSVVKTIFIIRLKRQSYLKEAIPGRRARYLRALKRLLENEGFFWRSKSITRIPGKVNYASTREDPVSNKTGNRIGNALKGIVMDQPELSKLSFICIPFQARPKSTWRKRWLLYCGTPCAWDNRKKD